MSYNFENIDVKALALAQNDYVIGMRRHFHSHPEVGLQEYETAKRIRSELDAAGIEWFPATETGTVGVIKGDGTSPENILALRADIDALNLTELVDWEYKSQVPGLMHGCGHDAHTAMLLGAARILKAELEGRFPGTLYLLFQPGEETTKGAHEVVKSGVLDGIKAIYGQHIWSYFDTGKVLTRGGHMMAGARMFRVDFTGIGGHGSALHKCVNPLTAAAAAATGLQSVVSQNIDAKDIATLCVGEIHSGSRPNIVPESAYITGTTRFFSAETDELLCQRIREMSEYTAKAYGVTCEVSFSACVPALNTDPALTETLKKSLASVAGEGNLLELDIEMGSEDFSEYGVYCPLVFSFVGCRNEEKHCTAGHHSGYFAVDEDALKIGVASYVRFAMDYFAQE